MGLNIILVGFVLLAAIGVGNAAERDYDPDDRFFFVDGKLIKTAEDIGYIKAMGTEANGGFKFTIEMASEDGTPMASDGLVKVAVYSDKGRTDRIDDVLTNMYVALISEMDLSSNYAAWDGPRVAVSGYENRSGMNSEVYVTVSFIPSGNDRIKT